MKNYRSFLFLLAFFAFIYWMNYLGKRADRRSFMEKLDENFSGIVVGHNDYRTLRLRIKLFDPDYYIELTDVSHDLYKQAEVGDTIIKSEVGNECVLLKKDTSFFLKCYVDPASK